MERQAFRVIRREARRSLTSPVLCECVPLATHAPHQPQELQLAAINRSSMYIHYLVVQWFTRCSDCMLRALDPAVEACEHPGLGVVNNLG